MDDAMTVYREVVKTTAPKKIGIFGTSTGGGMTLAMVLRAKQEGLPLPGAIAPATPWSDMTKTGDTYFANEMVDNILVSNDGWLADAANLYANGHDRGRRDRAPGGRCRHQSRAPRSRSGICPVRPRCQLRGHP